MNPFDQFDERKPVKGSANPFDQFDEEQVTPFNFGRIAAGVGPEEQTPFNFGRIAAGIGKPSFSDEQVNAGLINQVKQGATFGLGDEISSGLLAAPQYAGQELGRGIAGGVEGLGDLTGLYDYKAPNKYKSLKDFYEKNLNDERATLAASQQEMPLTSLGANLVGAIGTGALSAGTKGATAVANSLRSGNLATRIAKGAGYGAATGALYGFGSGEGEGRADSADSGAIGGAITGGAIPIAGSIIGAATKGVKDAAKGISARSGDELKEITKNLKGDAIKLKNQAELSKVILSPNEGSNLSSKIDEALAGTELIPEFSPKTLKVVQLIKEKAANGTLNLSQLDQYRRMLRSAYDEDGVAAGAVKRSIDSVVNNLSEEGRNGQTIKLLNQFRKDYSQASKFEDIADIAIKADGDPNKIKAGLTRFLNNDNNLNGFNKSEILALKTAARSTAPEKALKMLGKFGFDLGTSTTSGNTVAPLLGGGLGAGLGSAGVGVAVPAVGTVARQGQKYLARGKLENLLQTIEQGGKVTASDIASLPPKDAQTLLERMRSVVAPISQEYNKYRK